MDGKREGLILADPLGISQEAMFIPGPLALLLAMMDGTRDVRAMKTAFDLRTGAALSDSLLTTIVAQLDDALFLENERFTHAYQLVVDDYRSAPCRPSCLAGHVYPADANELSAFMRGHLDAVERKDTCPPEVKGIVSPHIDYARGGPIYAEVWAEAEQAVRDAELIVVLGTNHSDSQPRITLTTQSYATPWGTLPTPADAVEELAGQLGPSAFERELDHRGEHSVEAALVWLHYFRATSVASSDRDLPRDVLPILCGSFQCFVGTGESPLSAPHIAAAVAAMRRLCERRRTVIVAAGDLAHQGPAFGDTLPLDLGGKARMARDDALLIEAMASGDAEEFFRRVADEGDRRHVCGLSPIYLMLAALSGATGTRAGYAQCPADDASTSLVSICGMRF